MANGENFLHLLLTNKSIEVLNGLISPKLILFVPDPSVIKIIGRFQCLPQNPNIIVSPI